MSTKEAIDKITGSTYVQLGAAVAVLCFLVATAITVTRAITSFQIETKNSFKELSAEIKSSHGSLKRDIDENAATLERLDDKIVGKSNGGWHKITMERWSAVFEAQLREVLRQVAPDFNVPGKILPDVWGPIFAPKPSD